MHRLTYFHCFLCLFLLTVVIPCQSILIQSQFQRLQLRALLISKHECISDLGRNKNVPGMMSDSRSLGTSSVSSSQLSSNSDASFKSINSNSSFKMRKRRMKSDTNLFRDALHKSRKNMRLNKSNHSENTPGRCFVTILRLI